jgi:hypothetical protein
VDRYLRLPERLDYAVERRAGATRPEWRSRFDEARGSVAAAETALEVAQRQLSETVGKSDAWSVAPPGLPAEAGDNATDSFRLREEVRRQRAELARAQRRLRELEVEANLAGVPEEWRGPPSTESRPGDGNVSEAGAPP